jgi:hypothetical protein
MKTISKAALVVFALIAATSAFAPAFAEVQVTFTNPDSYRDAMSHGSYGARERASVLRRLEAHMHKLGERYLAEGETLKIEVLDLDLAGREEWWHGPQDLRVMRDITSPVMKVRYTLQRNGETLSSGDERITDRHYLMNSSAGFDSDALRFEKAMLKDWFRARFNTKSEAGS